MNKLIYYLAIFQLFVAASTAIGQSRSSSEKIFLQTDRDIYVAGEELFFKCYRLDATIQKPLVGSRFAYLVLRNDKNSLISGICLKLENNMFSGSIYLPDTLSTGRYQLVSYTNCMRNSGENSFFTKEILVPNRFDKDLIRVYFNPTSPDTLHKANSQVLSDWGTKELLTITPEKNTYSKREKIKISLEATGIKANDVAQLCVSVHEKTFQQENNTLINNNLLRTDNSGLPANNNSCLYLPEINGVILEGRVINTDNQQVIPKTTVFLSSPHTIANMQFTQTNSTGVFRFLLNGYYNNKNLILTLPDNTKGRIELDDKYDLKEPFRPSRQFSDSLLKDYLLKSQNIVQIQKTYKVETKKELTNGMSMQAAPPFVYPTVSNTVFPADFVSLPDFVEISREILPLLKTRKHGTKYEARMVDLDKSQFFDNDPLIFLDGVPINSINQIINLGTEKINKIESVGAERYDGNRYYSGILAVFSKKMEINNIVWQTPTLSTKYVQLHPSSIQVASVHSKTDKTPDFRQLLYWEPSLTLKANEKKYLEFSASDNKGEFEIAVEGITNEGNPIKVKATIKIASNSK